MSDLSTETPTARGHFVELDGWRAHIVRWGTRGAQPVLLLHGFTAHAQSWNHLASRLGPAFDIVALDQRGHGRSTPTDQFGSRVMVRDIASLLDALAWHSASIVGQSMGGLNAFLFEASLPERVDRLVIVDIGPEVDPAGAARIRDTADRVDTFATAGEAFDAARRGFPLADQALLEYRVRHNLVATRDGGWTWRTDRRLRDGSAVRSDHSTEERWQAWSVGCVPTLLVHGRESDVLTLPLIERMVRARPSTRVVHVDGAGHAVPLDGPDALADAVVAFLVTP